ncbi:uncharacterized protein LOC144098164 [Amblyomma americanum]
MINSEKTECQRLTSFKSAATTTTLTRHSKPGWWWRRPQLLPEPPFYATSWRASGSELGNDAQKSAQSEAEAQVRLLVSISCIKSEDLRRVLGVSILGNSFAPAPSATTPIRSGAQRKSVSASLDG